MSSEISEPTPGSIAVGSLAQAKRHKRRFDAVITLEDPHARLNLRLRFGGKPAPAHLVLPFEDVDVASLGIRVATDEQVSAAIEFARLHIKGSLLVHCFHGVGRSAAIALAVIADRLGPGAEREALDRLLAVRPEATPNLVVVELADRILQRSGHLVEALAAWEATIPRLKVVRAARLKLAQTHPELYARI